MSVFPCFLVIMISSILKIRFKCLNFFFVVIYYLFEHYANESLMPFKRTFDNVYTFMNIKALNRYFLKDEVL